MLNRSELLIASLASSPDGSNDSYTEHVGSAIDVMIFDDMGSAHITQNYDLHITQNYDLKATSIRIKRALKLKKWAAF